MTRSFTRRKGRGLILADHINELQAALEADDTRLGAVESGLNTKASTAAVTAVQGSVTTLQGTVTAVQGDVAAARTRIPYLPVTDYYQSGDGLNYAPALNRAIAALGGTRGEVVLPNRAEAYRTVMDLPSNVTVRGSGSATELVIDAALPTGRFLRSEGTVGTRAALTVDALAGAYTVALPTGAGTGFAAGDHIELQSNAIVYGTNGRTRDVRKIVAMSGDIVTLDAVLLHDVRVVDGATYAKVTPTRNVSIRDLLISNTNPGTFQAHSVLLRCGEGNSIHNVTIREGGGGIILSDQLRPVVMSPVIDGLPNGWRINSTSTGFGYGISLTGATSGARIIGLQSRHVRHAVTTLSDERTDTTQWGGPRDCLILGGVSHQDNSSGLGTSHFDTHEFGTNITFHGCQAVGGGERGFQVRAQRVKIIGCSTNRVGTHGVVFTSQSADGEIQGGEFLNSGVYGVGLSGPRTRMTGARIERSQQRAVIIGADDCRMEHCDLISNWQAGPGNDVVQWSAGARPRVIGNYAPFELGRQHQFTSNMPADAVIANNVLPGYGTGTLHFNANAAARIEGNVTDEMGVRAITGATTVAAGLTTILANATSSYTVTLPPVAGNKGRRVTVKKTDASANTITVGANASEKIDGTDTKVLGSQYATIELVCDGVAWHIVSQMGTVT